MSNPLVSLSISGQLPSMKNQRRLVRNRATGKPMNIKSQDAIDYEKAFLLQVPRKARIGYDGPVSLKCRIWYQSRRNDLDVSFLMDLLQKAGIIINDRQVEHVEAFKGLDKEYPRVLFSLRPHTETPQNSTKQPLEATISRKTRGTKGNG